MLAVFPNIGFLSVLEFNYAGLPPLEHYGFFSLCSFVFCLLAWPPAASSRPARSEGSVWRVRESWLSQLGQQLHQCLLSLVHRLAAARAGTLEAFCKGDLLHQCLLQLQLGPSFQQGCIILTLG